MPRPLHLALLVTAALALPVGDAAGQDVDRVSARLVQEVMPEADRFDEADGDPPVKRAYRGDELIGYVFITSDLPPEDRGYSGPIVALVGVTPDGVITGIRVTEYRESYRYERGDFLSVPWFLEQFAGKRVGDAFAVGRDIDGMSQVTISVRALGRGVRDAARRVVLAYMDAPEQPPRMPEAELVGLSWYEMQQRGVAASMVVSQRRRNPFEVSLIYVSSDELATHLLGEQFEYYRDVVEEAGGADEVVLYVVGAGGFYVPSLRNGWSIEQNGMTLELPRERVINMGRPGGLLAGQSTQVGALLLDDEDGIDIAAPLTFAMDRGRPDLGTFRVDYTSRAALVRVAEAAQAEAAQLVVEAATPPAEVDPESPPAEESAVAVVPPEPVAVAPASPQPSVVPAAEPTPSTNIAQVSEEEMFSETLWMRWSGVGWVLLVIALACLAFFTKSATLRWVSLGTTTIVLGWIDGSFLSISHVTGLVWVGLSAIRSDPALLVLSVFTLVTVLVWGRLFCGFLCPFGALQDIIDRFVPRRIKRELPRGAHRAASKVKYVILVVIMGAAFIGVPVSLYQYVEPFGTVFFWSSNVLLWVIAAATLVASAVVPRFYCRYACPLGALLAVGSLISLRRIRRVEQCEHCHVCEQRCPTRAITGPTIDFAECVRCNICEMQLIQQAGVCRHDMEVIRPRLVQLRDGRAAVTR